MYIGTGDVVNRIMKVSCHVDRAVRTILIGNIVITDRNIGVASLEAPTTKVTAEHEAFRVTGNRLGPWS